MTAVNVLRKGDAVHLITDGMGVGRAGVSFATKVQALPHLNSAMAVRGNAVTVALLLPLVSSQVSYDALKRSAGSLLRECLDEFGDLIDRFTVGGHETEMTVAGWTDSGETDAFAVVSHDRYPGIDPFTVTTLGELSVAPNDDQLMEEFFTGVYARNPSCRSFMDLCPREDGLALMELQRARQFDGRQIVGGFAQLTTVRRREISTCILRRWD